MHGSHLRSPAEDVLFVVILVLLAMVFHSVAEAGVRILRTIYALTGVLILQKLLGYNFSVAVWVGYIALFGIAVETGFVMVVCLQEDLDGRLATGMPLRPKQPQPDAMREHEFALASGVVRGSDCVKTTKEE